MICSRCKKNPAVVFVSNSNTPNQEPVGYCLVCAKELNIGPINGMLEKMGITDDQLNSVCEEMGNIMNGETDISELLSDMDASEIMNSDTEGDNIHGAPAFPFLQNLFGKQNPQSENSTAKESKSKNPSNKQDKKQNKNRKMLSLYCTDLTAKARNNQLDRIIGREEETSRVVQILSRRTKNNPCLIGEPGVGKTAIAEGLALKIANKDVPIRLMKKEIFLLDLTALVAGTQFRGQFEKRIKDLIDEVKNDGNIILFIDEVHNLVGAGESEGSMNAANILKPALSRGEIQVIGATTFTEYRKYIEKDTALERRFQPVKINEPSIADAINVLSGIKDYYENYHSVKVSDGIIRKIVYASERYITDRFLPDKAIDLFDEACTCASLRNKEKEKHDKLLDDKYSLEKNEELLSTAEEIDYEALAKVRSSIAKIDEEIEKIDKSCLNNSVNEDDIAHVIELWTGIPASKVKTGDIKKLADLENKLSSKVIGQDEAVKSLAAAIRRTRLQISPRRRPASFIFVGPTGVGKTELVKVLSTELFDTPETLIRLDMSEYMEKHSVSKIIGSPPGYVGYEEAGHVAEKVRRRPYSVLLFDEIEKAHADVLNILLQILDEGKLTDAHGRVVNFENTVIIMTSNAGSDKNTSTLGFEKNQADISRDKALKSLSEFLRPEFLGRIDEIIVFKQLTQNDFEKISNLMLEEYKEPLKDKGIDFTYSDELIKWIAEKSNTGKNGAREIRNTIRRYVEDQIAITIINSDNDCSSIYADIKNNEVTITSL